MKDKKILIPDQFLGSCTMSSQMVWNGVFFEKWVLEVLPTSFLHVRRYFSSRFLCLRLGGWKSLGVRILLLGLSFRFEVAVCRVGRREKHLKSTSFLKPALLLLLPRNNELLLLHVFPVKKLG